MEKYEALKMEVISFEVERVLLYTGPDSRGDE